MKTRVLKTARAVGKHYNVLATAEGLDVAFHVGGLPLKVLDAALETDDVWVACNLNQMIGQLILMTDDFLNDTGAFEGCKMPDPDKVIAQLRRLADKLEAKRMKWAAAGRLHPAERWRE
jgi:hypothetical protein